MNHGRFLCSQFTMSTSEYLSIICTCMACGDKFLDKHISKELFLKNVDNAYGGSKFFLNAYRSNSIELCCMREYYDDV